jgi:hypothetical protein
MNRTETRRSRVGLRIKKKERNNKRGKYIEIPFTPTVTKDYLTHMRSYDQLSNKKANKTSLINIFFTTCLIL